MYTSYWTNDLRLGVLGNKEILGKSQIWGVA